MKPHKQGVDEISVKRRITKSHQSKMGCLACHKIETLQVLPNTQYI